MDFLVKLEYFSMMRWLSPLPMYLDGTTIWSMQLSNSVCIAVRRAIANLFPYSVSNSKEPKILIVCLGNYAGKNRKRYT